MTNDERYAAIKVLLDGVHPVTAVAYDADNELALAEINDPTVPTDKLTTPQEAADATDGDEFNLLSDSDKNLWVGVLAWDTINLNAGIGLATATGIWSGAAGTVTRPALIATRTHLLGHSASEGLGNCTLGDIQNARAL